MSIKPQFPSVFDHTHFGTPMHSVVTGACEIATATMNNKTVYCTWGRNLTLEEAKNIHENTGLQPVYVGLIQDDKIGGPRFAYELLVDAEILPDLQVGPPNPSLGIESFN